MTEVNRLIKISKFLKVISLQIISPSHHPIERYIPKMFYFYNNYTCNRLYKPLLFLKQ